MSIKSKARRGPFTAQPWELWVDADIADWRESRLLDAIQALVDQFAGRMNDGRLHSMDSAAMADAMRLLAQEGRFEIMSESGRRVIGTFKS